MPSDEKFERIYKQLMPELPQEIDMALFLRWAVCKSQFDFYNSSDGDTREEALRVLYDINQGV